MSKDPALFDLSNSMQTEYFRLTELMMKRYGPNTILFMQVGAFFEIYATKSPETGKITRSRIEEVSAICGGLAITDKKQMHGKDLVVMAGFRDYSLDRYLQLVVDADMTAVVYTQKEIAPGKMTRELSGVYSPGTFLPADADTSTKMSNRVLCIWIDQIQAFSRSVSCCRSVCGAATVDIFTGESALFEYEPESSEIAPATFDPLERFVSTHAPSETIFVSPFPKDTDSNRVLQYIGVQSRVIHLVNSSPDAESVEVDRCRQQKYVRHILSTFFREDSYDLCEEFRNYSVATQAYCYLLHFIQERNPNLVRKIALPIFDNQTTNVLLANHTLRQLNIIDDGNSLADQANLSTSHLRSVGAFLNKCCSALGKRRFQSQIAKPTFDEAWLNREYDAIAMLLDSYEMVDAFRKLCREVADLEKIARQLISRKMGPDSVARLYKSAIAIQQIQVCLCESPELCDYLVDSASFDGGGVSNPNSSAYLLEHWIDAVLSCISANLVVERLTTSFDQNIMQPGVCPELDALSARMAENEALFHEIRYFFNAIFQRIDGAKSATDYVRVHETEKSGTFLQLTKKRSATLKKYLADLLKQDPHVKLTIMLSGKTTIPLAVSEIRLSSAGSTNDVIEFPLLDRIIREKLSIKDEISQTAARAYAEFVERLETDCLAHIGRLANFAARVDVLQAKTFVARTYGYCRPVIESGSQPSYVDAKGLRHVLIEHIQTQELYVANDICLSKSNPDFRGEDGHEQAPTGILLYGTNAVGKTSLIRALGIAVIMAQSGMYVPCLAFTYRPYRAIFTRILGNDNLFKNLSMFAVEMSELRVILNSADQYSLVLGDELCSGTETESALSIFAAGLSDLHDKGATFLFATHFHEILKFDEIRDLHKICVKHMAVHYDREQDCLVYDRLLRDGPGNRLYGLEVAKSLHLPDDFIERSYMFRNKYFADMRGDLAASPSRYNAAKIRAMCENCGESWATETHHLQEQRLADERGRIGGINMNHPANLMSLCERCHRGVHFGNDDSGSISSVSLSPSIDTLSQSLSQTQTLAKPKIIRKKTTKGYKLSVETA